MFVVVFCHRALCQAELHPELLAKPILMFFYPSVKANRTLKLDIETGH
jgi:hypothetical protein